MLRVLLVQKVTGISGSENYILELTEALVKRGIDARFAMIEDFAPNTAKDDFVEILKQSGAPVYRIRSSPFKILQIILALRRIVRTERIDVVHTNLIHADFFGAIVKYLLPKGPVFVSTKHGYREHFQAEHGFDPDKLRWDAYAVATWIAGRSHDRVICVSKGVSHLLVGSGLIEKKRVEVIYNGLSFSRSVSRGEPGKYRFGVKQLLCVARFVPYKQHESLIRAMPRLADTFPDIKLVLLGDGPLAASLKQLARVLSVADHIVFVGFQNNVHDYMRDSDIFVLPSTVEGFGLVLIEAWFNHLPVVCLNVPALNEIVTDRFNGRLLPRNAPEALPRTIEDLFRHPEEMKRIGENGRLTYEANYTVDILADRTIALYQSLLE
jgi:glycosyltransferase involved in cell wall biosynthesis